MTTPLLVLNPRYRPEIVEPDHVLLLDEGTFVGLTGKTAVCVARFLQHRSHAIEAIIQNLHETLSLKPEVARSDIMHMVQDRILVEQASGLPLEAATFWERLDIASSQVAQVLCNTSIAIEATGAHGLSGSCLKTALESLGMAVHAQGELTVVVVADYLDPQLASINEAMRQAGRPWMLVKPVGKASWIGPLFNHETACWACMSHRLGANRRAEAFLSHHRGDPAACFSPPASFVPPTLTVAYHVAALEIAKWIVNGTNAWVENAFISVDAATWNTRRHVVTRRPQCPICGHPTPRRPSPLTLASRKKKYRLDGGHRPEAPGQAFDRYKHLIDEEVGFVRRLRRVPSTLPGAPTVNYVAEHSIVSHFDALAKLRANEGFQSAGKGKTDDQAKASALFEALERISSVWQGDEYVIRASYNDLKPAAVHPPLLLGYSDSQYATRETWNGQCLSITEQVPARFDPDEAIAWAPVWSLTNQRVRYVPAAYGYFDCQEAGTAFCRAHSNGNAAGNALEDAIVQGFLELVERDAAAIWWYNRLRRPGVDLASFNEPFFLELQTAYRTIERDLWVLDLTHDLAIPTFVAVSRRTDRLPEDIVFGMGCHFDPRLAVSRALTEVEQLRTNVAQDTPEGATLYHLHDPAALHWFQTATLANQPYLAPDEGVVAKTAADFPYTPTDDLLDDVDACLEAAAANRLEVLVLNLTHPDIGLPVVKVMIPGVRIYWRRLAVGRLYNVPVKMGWRLEPLPEEAMNPCSIVW